MAGGYVIWFTGLSGSGKTTLSLLTKELLERNRQKVQLIDGDTVREFFKNDLGFTEPERKENVKRIIFAASLLAENGISVIVANIAPYYEVRDIARRTIKNYTQVYLEIDIDTARARDVKGLYKAFDLGKTKNIIGLDTRYDIPRRPDLVIRTADENPEASLLKIEDLLVKKGLLRKGKVKV